MKPTDPITLICCAIASQEGWFSKDRTVLPVINNNPGDLQFAGQLNAVKSGRWAKFSSPQAGEAALFRQVLLQVAEHQTLRQLINQWAPAAENNTSAYLANVMKWTGIPPDVPILQLLSPLVALD